MNATVIDVDHVVEHSRFGPFHMMLLALCGLCLIIDGFDIQAMGYVAPAIIADWHINRASLGPVFGASVLGMLLGSLILTPISDRFGRRPMLIMSMFYLALCMAVTTQVESIQSLLVLRFITGLGLGGLMPSAMALASEFSPSSSRVTRMMWVSCGFTAGAAIGGFVSAALIPAFGWRSVFIVGSFTPFLLALAMLFWLPESLQFLVLRQAAPQRITRWLRKLDPALTFDATTRFIAQEPATRGTPVSALFQQGRTRVTLLLWLINFMNLLNLYFLSNWLPTLVKDAGYSNSGAVLIGTSLQVGGVIGTLSLGWFISRFGFIRVLSACFIVGAGFIALIGSSAAIPVLLFVSVLSAGFCIIGGQPGVNALAGTYYPTALRSTGIGWSLGIGRIGSVMGTVLGGQLIALQWSNSELFMAAAVPALLSAMLVMKLNSTEQWRPLLAK